MGKQFGQRLIALRDGDHKETLYLYGAQFVPREIRVRFFFFARSIFFSRARFFFLALDFFFACSIFFSRARFFFLSRSIFLLDFFLVFLFSWYFSFLCQVHSGVRWKHSLRASTLRYKSNKNHWWKTGERCREPARSFANLKNP